jgi:hypothetical protein
VDRQGSPPSCGASISPMAFGLTVVEEEWEGLIQTLQYFSPEVTHTSCLLTVHWSELFTGLHLNVREMGNRNLGSNKCT